MFVNKKFLISILVATSLNVFADTPSTDANVEPRGTNVARWYATLGSPKAQKKVAKKKVAKKKKKKSSSYRKKKAERRR